MIQPAFAAVPFASRQELTLEQRLQADPLTRELMEVANDFARRAASVDPDGLRAVIERRDSEAFAGLMGFTIEQLNAENARLDEIRAELLGRYPELVEIAAEQSRGECGLDISLESCGGGWLPANTTAAVDIEGTSCNWVPYTAALALCTAAGPIFYWACAIVALCTFCSGGAADTICKAGRR